MLVHEALRLVLLADADVIAITTRIYPSVLPQDCEFPALVYDRQGKETIERMDSRGHAGLAAFIIRFWSISSLDEGGADTVYALDEAVRLCLQGYSGSVADPDSSPEESVYINGIFYRETRQGYDDKTRTYQCITDYEVWAGETQP